MLPGNMLARDYEKTLGANVNLPFPKFHYNLITPP